MVRGRQSIPLPELLREPPEDLQEGVRGYQRAMAEALAENARLVDVGKWREERVLPAQFFRNYEKALQLFDESTRFILGHLRRSGYNVACAMGCSHCCRQIPLGVEGVEILYLYFGLQQTGLHDRFFRRALEREELWAEVCRWRDVGEAAHGGPGAEQEAYLFHYCRHGEPCPFLEGDLCRVYLYRPIACRMHFSLSAPYLCGPSMLESEEALQINLEPGERVWDALETLSGVLGLQLSDRLVCGFLEFVVNHMRFAKIQEAES
ncbi:YkgJ family cysteine cluster protein [Desulfoglaeba alkanexedens]|jgi:Fe-S-cluster containining protein|uniref:YkgJ family cysteine cluster protein n=1 Tax=Desulfoglaeba alkanexedens ALDC TaxID=980445 RepID=A0A4P8L6X9_9BACT|nr:YkgJ family cysteine cluster protein [Desulfoglaeba alkanexedens]QCQ22895.1 YkgJ family cysteine cluster protein [Desulfoglaeba alkanexedens ALDC]